MPNQLSRRLLFLAVAISGYILTDWGFHILAKVQVANQAFDAALQDTVQGALENPIGILVSVAPYVAIALICASLARIDRNWAVGLLVSCLFLFGVMYYSGHMQSQEYMLGRKWTAASLAVGLVPFKSLLIVIAAFVLRIILGRRRVPEAT